MIRNCLSFSFSSYCFTASIIIFKAAFLCGLTVKFFCCSPTCQPTNWLKCQISKVSAHPDRFICLGTILYEHRLFMSSKANSFLKILCIITTSALATPNTNKTPVYSRFQQYTGTFLNRYLAVIGTYLLID